MRFGARVEDVLSLKHHAIACRDAAQKTLMSKTLLFLCSGNTCRSPLALAAWETLPEKPPGVRALSAGLFASPGAPASPYTQEIARQWGFDLSPHRSRQVQANLLRDCDVVCVMTPEHGEVLRTHYEVPGTVVLLGSLAGSGENAGESGGPPPAWLEWETSGEASSILDPFGGSREAYESCAQQIQRAVSGLATALRDGTLPAGTI
jgi:protein-tyrosine phosphatase